MKKAEEKSTTSTQKRDAQSNDSYVSNYTHNLMVAQEVQEVNGLKIDPTFRDVIPKLTEDEFSQLEKNILADGRVKEPIVVWNNTIIDGHHRFYVVLMHPEIPYETEERHFENEWAAMAWVCANQLGRRNLSDMDHMYLIGEQYKAEKMAHGGDRKSSNGNRDLISKSGRTATKIAKEHGVGQYTVQQGEKIADAIDIAEELVPGAKEKILHGDAGKARGIKGALAEIPEAQPEKQEKAAKAILEGKPDKAKQILHDDSDMADKLHNPPKKIKFSEHDLLEELTVNFDNYIESLHITLESHADILKNKETKEDVIKKLKGLFESEIAKLQEV